MQIQTSKGVPAFQGKLLPRAYELHDKNIYIRVHPEKELDT
jgi:hypothetical protein